MLLLLVLSALIHLGTPQCLTSKDEIRKLNDAAHTDLLESELKFAIKLWIAAASLQPEDNLLLSPSSVFQATLLAYFFSANQTEQNLKEALNLHNSYDKLDIFGAYYMENYYQKLQSVKSQSYLLSSVNRFYIAKDLKLQYCIKVLFSEELFPANFKENSQGVVKKINQWVAGQTRNVIKDFLSKDQVSQDTQLVLVNAAYFKGKWKIPFNEEETFEGKFKLNNGTQITTTMMSVEGNFRYKMDKKLGAEVVELPYVGEDITMNVILPLKHSPSAIQDMLKKLDSKGLQNLVQALASKESAGPKRTVAIPKFTMESELDLKKILELLGVKDLFQKSADLSTLAPGLQGFSEAIHKAKIRVDEKGAEAAAATSFISARLYVESFTADHPFLYTVFDKRANNNLFIGIFNYPEAKAS